jgi:hypothetical protein
VDPRTLTRLELPYRAYAGSVDARDLVLAGLRWPTEYWVGLAIGWLEQGVPIDEQIFREVQRLGSVIALSQGLKHRVFALTRQHLQSLPIEELDVVRVVALHQKGRAHEGTESVKREPRVGDMGTVVHVYEPKAGEPLFAVEAIDKDGLTLWLADLKGAELKLEAKHNAAGA